jgi:hypothetical protein
MTVAEIAPGVRDQVRLYFFDIHLRYAFATLFVGLVLVPSNVGIAMVILGLIWLVASSLLTRSRLPEPEVDRLLSEDADALVADAQRRFRVEDEELKIKPLVLVGPVEPNVPSLYESWLGPRTGRDGRRRSPINRVVILVPMESCLGIYSCCRDFLRNATSQLTIEEHNYRDVVSLKLETLSGRTQVKSLDSVSQKQEYAQVLSLELGNQRKLIFPVSSEGREAGAEDEQPPTGTERTMRAIQTLLGGNR